MVPCSPSIPFEPRGLKTSYLKFEAVHNEYNLEDEYERNRQLVQDDARTAIRGKVALLSGDLRRH